jgi:hypothetical protein
MGCGSSKHALERVDDSLHVMLVRDRKSAKKAGKAVESTYVPRAEHPLMAQATVAAAVAVAVAVAAAEDDTDVALDQALQRAEGEQPLPPTQPPPQSQTAAQLSL